jgi:hypothetical protein
MQEVGGSIPPGSTKYQGTPFLNLVKIGRKNIDGAWLLNKYRALQEISKLGFWICVS